MDAAAHISAALLSYTPPKHLVLGLAGAPQLWGRRGAHPALRSCCQSGMDISAAFPGRYKQLQEQGALDRRRVLIVPVLWEGPFCLPGCSSATEMKTAHNPKKSFE